MARPLRPQEKAISIIFKTLFIMAKGNILLGMGRGKLGDIVLTRIDGQQIARPRNRQPKNPRTNKQLYQRAVMATVMQAYSAGIKIFDHSFQGKSVGAGNQRYFMRINAKKLRAQVANDINNAVAVAEQQGRVIAPGVASPVPSLLTVSEGSLTNVLFGGSTLPTLAAAGEKLNAFCARLGIQAEDLYTFVGFVVPNGASTLFTLLTDSSDYSKQFATQFVYARYTVKASALTSESVQFGWGDIFELTDSNFTPIWTGSELIVDNVGQNVPKITTMVAANAKGTYAWIHSRINEDLRSSETMKFDGVEYGIASEYALAAWKQGSANLGDSDLILEGGDE
jgi:hypothetical protein